MAILGVSLLLFKCVSMSVRGNAMCAGVHGVQKRAFNCFFEAGVIASCEQPKVGARI